MDASYKLCATLSELLYIKSGGWGGGGGGGGYKIVFPLWDTTYKHVIVISGSCVLLTLTFIHSFIHSIDIQ